MSLLNRICRSKPQLLQCRQLSTLTLQPFKSPVRTFQKLLDKRPLLTNCLIGGFFMFAGDLTQQLYFNSVIKWKEVYIVMFFLYSTSFMILNVHLQLAKKVVCSKSTQFLISQVALFTSLGLVYGPVGATWYRYLDIWFPGTAIWPIVKKLVVDEITWGPAFACILFYVLPYVETQSHEKAVSELKEKFLTGWLGSAGFWAIFQSFNYRYIPNKYRMTYFMGISFIYDTGIAIYKYQF